MKVIFMNLIVYLSGEIHSEWREQIMRGIQEYDLPVEILRPVTTHEASDNVGVEILGAEDKGFWKDHKAAKINSIRIKNAIEKADVVVVRFGEKYRQWNAAFEAGYAVAKGKQLITLHPSEFTHALKEVDASAVATTETPQQVVEILKYVTMQE
jgi:YtoQ family protein